MKFSSRSALTGRICLNIPRTLLGEKAAFVSLDAGADCESCQISMRGAVKWLFQ